MAHILQDEDENDEGGLTHSLATALSKAVEDGAPWLTDAIETVVNAEAAKIDATITGLNARLDQVMSAVNPSPRQRRSR